MGGWTLALVAAGLLAASPAVAQDSDLAGAPAPAPPSAGEVAPGPIAPAPAGAEAAGPAVGVEGVPPLPAGAQVRDFSFTRVVAKLRPGQVWSAAHGGIFCMAEGKRVWQGGQQDQKIDPYSDTLRTEMKAVGFKLDGDPGNLFEPAAASTSDLQLAAVINDIDMDYCMPLIGYGDTGIRGTIRLDVEWQVYSSLQKTVLAKIQTHGTASFKSSTPGGVTVLITAGFKQNVDQLMASDAFRKVVIGGDAPAETLARPTPQPAITLVGALAPGRRGVADEVASVVMIFAGETQGSGFLASSDGMLITDRHVVGDAKFVKVRWSDGIETLGEVIRVDKVRDVALVKTEPRGRQPIPLRRDPLQPGETVFAVGAPLDQKFQSTVTRGVVSANRTFDGLSFIQSDVSVNPGSSGGPLLDEKGAAVGMTEAGYRIGGAPANINLFIPIGDALDFLSAQPK
jgi:S1-C subfamily serine protease